MAEQQVATVKIAAFRQFATTIAAQVTEQLCAEFEREVSALTDDLVMYRTELARCGELLAHQLGREKQLHGMLENIAGNTMNLVASAQDVGKKHDGGARDQMHQMVEQMYGQQASALSTTINGVSEAHQVTHAHLAQAKELQNQALTAENELNRIMAILEQPTVRMGSVGPTVARVPGYAMAAPQFPRVGGSQNIMSPVGGLSPTRMGGVSPTFRQQPRSPTAFGAPPGSAFA